MAQRRSFSAIQQRLTQALPSFSEAVQRDIRALFEICEAVVRIADSFESDQEVEAPPERASAPSKGASAKQKGASRVPAGSRSTFGVDEMDDFRLKLLRADKKGTPEDVQRVEREIKRAYRARGIQCNFRGLRSHLSGSWRGPFLKRVLERAQANERKALLAELVELYGESQRELIAASKLSPRQSESDKKHR